MMILSHVFVGGVIGQEIPNPYLAFILAFLSHLLIDKIPHFWPKIKKMEAFFTWLDVFISLAVMLAFWFIGFHGTGFWAGIAGSTSLDVMAMTAKFSGKMKFYEWQNKRQPHFGKPLFLITDFMFVVAGVLILMVIR